MTKEEFTELCKQKNLIIFDADGTAFTPEEFEELLAELFPDKEI